MKEENIGVLSAGERFGFKGFEWIVLDNNVDGGVLAIMASAWNNEEYSFDDDGCNNYAKSSLRRKLLNELLPVLGEDNLIPHEVDMVADNGDDRYGTVTDRVFILSCDEYRKYRKHVPLLPEWMWTCTPWYISDAGDSYYVRSVYDTGSLKGNWYQLIMKAYQLDAGVRKTFFQNFIVNSALKGSAIQNEIRERENCNVPWAVLLDPTSACNLHCTGCWAAEYGHKLSLDLETIDSIIRQGKEMGTYMYIYTGGEPMVRKKDLITLCERHPDCEFLSFTNGTLIDEAFCQEMLRVKNFVPAISLEGFEQANDGRRGQGVFEKVMRAMDLLRKNKLPFGISTCYTSANYADISSEAFFDMMIEMGAMFVWLFHYMPVGNEAVPELLPTPEQRKTVYERIRAFARCLPVMFPYMP